MTIRSPGSSPFVTSTSSPMRHPVSTSRGSKYPWPRSTNTVLRSPESTIASAGTTSVGGRSTGNSTSTNMPGLSARCGFAASSRTFSVSVASSKIGSDGLTVARSAWLPSAVVIRAEAPRRMNGRSWRYTSARIHTRLRSAIRYSSNPRSNRRPGETPRFSTTPSTGDSTRMSRTSSRRWPISRSCELVTPRVRSSSAIRSISSGPREEGCDCARGPAAGGGGCVSAMR